MSAESDTLEGLIRVACEGAEEIGGKFTDPDADWFPVGMFYGPDGVAFSPIDTDFFESSLSKTMLFGTVLPRIAREQRASAVALIVSAWGVEARTEEEAQHAIDLSSENRLEEHPRKVELVYVYVCDGSRMVGLKRLISRKPGKPPRLTGEWEREEDGVDGIVLRGDLPVGLAKALGYALS